MKTVEERCKDLLIAIFTHDFSVKQVGISPSIMAQQLRVEEWNWGEEPNSIAAKESPYYGPNPTVQGMSHHPSICIPIDDLIMSSDETECLTSNIEYVRECRRWSMKNKARDKYHRDILIKIKREGLIDQLQFQAVDKVIDDYEGIRNLLEMWENESNNEEKQETLKAINESTFDILINSYKEKR